MSDFPQTADDGGGFANIGMSKLSPDLERILAARPGDQPDYELAKSIYTAHPLGAKIAEAPVRLAQSQDREIKIPGAPEEDLKKAFADEWKKLGNNRIEAGGADRIIRQICVTSRIYGISTGGMVCKGYEDLSKPIPAGEWHKLPLQFSVWDPLNTAGSMVFDQNPASVNFMKPQAVKVAGQTVDLMRCIVKMQEMPVWIKWSDSAFGFVGRSVFQRPLYPLKTYLLSMIADGMIAEKVGLLVHKAESPGSILDKITNGVFGLKRGTIKGAKTGQVISIGLKEELNSINLQMLAEPHKVSREHIKQDIASATPMPSALLAEETLTQGFGEGTNDYKLIVSYIAAYRTEIMPVYDYFDEICMHKAWSPDFYETMQRKYSDYKKMDYNTAFQQWKNSFSAEWPSLMQEEPSKEVEVDHKKLEGAVGAAEVLMANLPQSEKAKLVTWFSSVVNSCKFMFDAPLELDEEVIAKYEPPNPMSEPNREPETSAAYDV